MSINGFSASALIPAPALEVYRIIADYETGHPEILPRPPFTTLEVLEGGVGAGTSIKVGMKFMGQAQSFTAVITEPTPGRVLVETNDNGYETTFTVEPRDEGMQAFVTIATELKNGRSGILGKIEQWLIKRMLLPVYERELALLTAVAQK